MPTINAVPTLTSKLKDRNLSSCYKLVLWERIDRISAQYSTAQHQCGSGICSVFAFAVSDGRYQRTSAKHCAS